MDKLKVGILGLGRGRTHLSNFLKLDDVQVVGAADRLDARREAQREVVEQAGGRLFGEFDGLLAAGIDAVVVASNGKLQVEHACQALEAGVAVLSEIPGAYTLEELVRLRDTVERTGTLYMLAENTSFWDFFRHFRKWVVEDRFGPISLAEGEYVHYIPSMIDAPDGRRLTPRQAVAEGLRATTSSWRADQPPIQYSTHDIGPLLEVLDDRIVSVSCRSAPWRCQDTPLRCDGQYALFETAKGTLIRILVTLSCNVPSEHRYRVLGIEGGCEWFLYERFGRLCDRHREHGEGWQKIKIDLAAPTDDPQSGHGGADGKVARCFVDAVRAGGPSPIDVYRAIEYGLPGIIAAKSADLGGAPLPIPDLRRTPFMGTTFWDHAPLPEHDAEVIE